MENKTRGGVGARRVEAAVTAPRNSLGRPWAGESWACDACGEGGPDRDDMALSGCRSSSTRGAPLAVARAGRSPRADLGRSRPRGASRGLYRLDRKDRPMHHRTQIRAVGRALAAGDIVAAATLARELAPYCDREGLLGQYTPVREILDAIASLPDARLGPAAGPALDLSAIAGGEITGAAFDDALASVGLALRSIPTHAGWTASGAGGPDGGMPRRWRVEVTDRRTGETSTGEGGTPSLAAAEGIRVALRARHADPDDL